MIRKEIYLSFLLSILLFVSTDILFYKHIVLGKENNDNDEDNRDSRDDDIIEKDEDDNGDKKFEDISINSLLMLYLFLNYFILKINFE